MCKVFPEALSGRSGILVMNLTKISTWNTGKKKRKVSIQVHVDLKIKSEVQEQN